MFDNLELRIMNVEEHEPYKKVIVKRKREQYTATLFSWLRQETLPIASLTVIDNRIRIERVESSEPIHTFRKSGVYTRMKTTYEKGYAYDVDVSFVLTDARIVMANLSELKQVEYLLPIFDETRWTLQCSECHSLMVKRVAKTGKNTGNEFYGCSQFPNCKNIVNI